MRCVHYTHAKRCVNDAEFHVIQPDGQRNPGSRICRRHGEAIVKEYADKLGEQWTLQPIDEHGTAID